MTISLPQSLKQARTNSAFSLVDALFAVAASGVMFLALYAGLGFGFNVIKFARENTRATQIMLEKMETIRLYTWSQITEDGFIPTNTFTVPYYAVGGTNSSLVYTGRISIAESEVNASYADNMKKVTIQLDWTTGHTPRTRSMVTFVAKNGLQSYVW